MVGFSTFFFYFSFFSDLFFPYFRFCLGYLVLIDLSSVFSIILRFGHSHYFIHLFVSNLNENGVQSFFLEW